MSLDNCVTAHMDMGICSSSAHGRCLWEMGCWLQQVVVVLRLG